MNVIVCLRRVPDTSEAELSIHGSGRGIRTDDLAFGVNEWDNYAIEAAVLLKESRGARVTALTVGGADDEEVLRRALAMGADEAAHLLDPAFEGSDALGIATILAKAIAARPYDLILTGAVSADAGRGQVGGMIAALLGIPHVALATELVVNGARARVRHEVEGGLERVVDLALPAVVSVQTGINEPRYVSIRGIRKVAEITIPAVGAKDLGIDPRSVGEAGARVVLEETFPPPRREGGEILEGDDETRVAALVERLRQKGVI